MADILEYGGEGYKTVMSYGAWRVAFLNYAQRFDETFFEKIERHNETDEIFVLLSGKATLILGEELERLPMEKEKAYNVRRGEWHHIFVSRDAKVLIAENADTGTDNTDYKYFKNAEAVK